MTLKKIKQINLKLALITTIIVSIIFRDINMIMPYILGLLASMLNFEINIKLSKFDLKKNAFLKSMNSFLIRMLIYAIVLTLSFKIYNEYAMILTFLGCLSIRVSVFLLIFSKEGGDLNE